MCIRNKGGECTVHLDSVRLQIKHEGSSMPSLIGWGAWTWRDGQLSARSATPVHLTSLRPIVQCYLSLRMALASSCSCDMIREDDQCGKTNYFDKGYIEFLEVAFADHVRMIFRVRLSLVFTCK